MSIALLTAVLLCPLAANSFGGNKKPRPVDPSTLMKREETMVLNLQTGSKSAKYFVLHSLKTTRDMQRDLFKAMRQVETVDSNYAKARKRPDDRTLAGTVTRLKKAQEAAEQLEKELDLVNQQLKSDIQSTLIRN
jgi:hypothetical protein